MGTLTDSYKIMIVDDSDEDRQRLRQAVEAHPKFTVVAEVCQGDDAVAYLRGDTIFSERDKYPLPDAILVDSQMPGMTGFDVLQWIRSRSFQDIAVVVRSDSDLALDESRGLALGADAVQDKSGERDHQKNLLNELENILEHRRRHHPRD